MILTDWPGVNVAWGDAHIRIADDEPNAVFSVGMRFWLWKRCILIDCWGRAVGVVWSVDASWDVIVIGSLLVNSVVTVGSLVRGDVLVMSASSSIFPSVLASV